MTKTYQKDTKKPRIYNAVVGQTDRRPWLNLHLTKEVMNYLWDIINNSPVQLDARNNLVGNISKSTYLQEKDNWLYENVLKLCSETIYFKEWNNYYNVHIAKTVPPPIFTLKDIWVNYQKQHEFNPPHNHNGEYSFVIFMKIPTHWKEQHTLPRLKNIRLPCASDFQFILGQGQNTVEVVNIPLSPEDEGRILFFPALLYHQVFPFYNTEKERITVSGNIVIGKVNTKEEKKRILEHMEQRVKEFKEMMEPEK